MVRRLMALQFSSILIGIIAVVSFVTIYNLQYSFSWVNHTHAVIHQVNHIQSDVQDCQTSVRETVFGDEKQFINLYISKSPGLESQLDNLQWLTRDNEIQQKNVYELRLNIGRRLEAFREVLELYNAGKNSESKNVLKEKFGEAWVSSTRNIVEIIVAEENRLLNTRLLDYKNKAGMAMYGIPILLIIYIFVFNITTKSISEKLDIRL